MVLDGEMSYSRARMYKIGQSVAADSEHNSNISHNNSNDN